MKKLTVLLLVLVLALVSACTAKEDAPAPETHLQETEITVAAAASLTDVTKELAEKYNETNPNVKIVFTYASSGALQTQIEEGAPIDVFISAAKKQMTELNDKDLIAPGTAKDLLKNQIVLIVPADSDLDISGFADCDGDAIKIIAFGDPKTTPAGQYAQDVFEKLGIWDDVNAKANFASDVRQVLTYVESGDVDCGVVFKTDAMTSDKVKVIAPPPAAVDSPAIYPVGIIAGSSNLTESQKFVDFLFTEEAKVIFEDFGFETVK